MAFTQWPFDFAPDGTTPQEVTEDQFRHTLALASQSGVVLDSGTGGGEALRVTAVPDSSGVDITSGYAQVNGYTCFNDATETIPAPANSASDPRRYWVVLRLDRSARTITPEILIGAAAANPQLPSLTRDDTTWDLPLAEFRRAGSGGAITNLIDRRNYVNASGAVRARSTARPPLPRAGDLIYESDTERWMGWDGSLWRLIWEDSGELGLSPGFGTWEDAGSGGSYGRRIGDVVTIRVSKRRLSSPFVTTDEDGSRLAVLPSTLRPLNRFVYAAGQFTGGTSGGTSCRVEVRTDGEVWALYPTSNVPVGRVLTVTITYIRL